MASIISAGTTSGTSLNLSGDTSGVLQLASNGSTTAVTIDTSQRVLIGATSASGFDSGADNLIVGAGSGSNGITIYSGNTSTAAINFADGTTGSDIYAGGITYNHNTNNLDFATTDGSGRMRIDTSGNVGVGTTTPATPNNGGICFNPSATSSSIQVAGSSTSNGNNGFLLYSTGSSSYKFYVGYGGTISAVSTSISSLSDQSLKENIVDLPTGLTQVMSLKPRKFDWKDGEGTGEKNVDGFIAQELQEVMPNLVTQYQYNETEKKLGIKMGDLVPTLVKAIQELKAELDATKAEVQALKGTL